MFKLLNNMKLKTRLISSFLLVAVIMLVTLSVAILNVGQTTETSQEMTFYVADPFENLIESRTLLTDMELRLTESRYIQEENPQRLYNMIDFLLSKKEELKARMDDLRQSFQFEETQARYDQFLEYMVSYEITLRDFIAAIDDGHPNQAYFIGTLTRISEQSMEAIDFMFENRLLLTRHLIEQNRANAQQSLIILIILSIFGVSLTVVFGIFFAVTISKPILECVEIMKILASGDFTVRLPDEYGAEMGQLFSSCNAVIEAEDMSAVNLARAIDKLRESAQGMIAISSEMAESCKGLNQQTSSVGTTTEEFSASMTQTSNTLIIASSHISSVASSIEETNSTLATVATAAEQTSTMVHESSTLVDNIQESIIKTSTSANLVSNAFNSVADSLHEKDKSLAAVNEHSAGTKNKVSDANEKAKNTNEIIRRLEEASRQIGKIVNVISDIADQTNMLALNAAIEAAGAGEAGKGFMVVANEVKELAKQTSDATHEIADQIENMQRNMPEAVSAVSEITVIINSMTEFINSIATEIGEHQKLSDQITGEFAVAAKQLNEITNEINMISDNAGSVTRTVIDSSKSVSKIAKSASELVIGTQEVAMNSERASNNMNEINQTVKNMATGILEISKSVQLISAETGAVQKNADSTKTSSLELLKIANDLEEMISRYKTN
ncbi:MAG: methyl-accepting chemotaxis protein [Oscillospiraceae bacterium]|nr:methyl-accepting chemotaxis protein [Oscillospiraceae bacterium]